MTAKEPLLVEKIGLDAALFLRFLRMTRNLFIVLSIAICVVTIPINIVQSKATLSSDAPDDNGPDILSIINLSFPYLWVHVGMAYAMTFYTMWVLWSNYRDVVSLRWDYFRSEDYQRSLHARTLIMTHVPQHFQSDEGMAALINDYKMPYQPSQGQIGRGVGELPKLIEEHEQCVRKLEHHLARYLKNPNSLPSTRPTERVGGMCGSSVDAIDWYTARIEQLEREIAIARETIDSNKATNYGFVSFPAVPYAHAVAKRIGSRRHRGLDCGLAPMPADIKWSNLEKSRSELRAARGVVGGVFILFCIVWTVPLALISILANTKFLSTIWPAFNKFIGQNDQLNGLLQGYLAPVVLSLITAFILPWFFKQLSKWQGTTTKSELERSVMAKMYLFQVLNTFVILTIYTAVIKFAINIACNVSTARSASDVWDIVRKQHIINKFSDSFIQASNFWINQTTLRGVTVLFDLAQLIALSLGLFRSAFLSTTPRETRDWSKPPDFEFALYYSSHLFQATVTICYAVVAPLIIPFTAVYFAMSCVVYKYLLMYVYTTKIETGGMTWRLLFNRLLFALIFASFILGLVVWAQSTWQNALALAPLPFILVIFKIFCMKKFDDRFTYYIPDQKEHEEMIIHNNDARKNRLQQRFGHYTLTKDLITPMVHARARHLLSQVYKGRVEEENIAKRGGTIKRMTIAGPGGGLRFEAINEENLEYDPAEYRNEYMAAHFGDIDQYSMSDVKSDAASVYGHQIGASGGMMNEYANEYGHGYGEYGPTPEQLSLGRLPNQSRTRLLDSDYEQARYAEEQQYGRRPSAPRTDSGSFTQYSTGSGPGRYEDDMPQRSMSPSSYRGPVSPPMPGGTPGPYGRPLPGSRQGTPGLPGSRQGTPGPGQRRPTGGPRYDPNAALPPPPPPPQQQRGPAPGYNPNPRTPPPQQNYAQYPPNRNGTPGGPRPY